MTLRELINQVTEISPNQTVLNLTDFRLDFDIKLRLEYDDETDFYLNIDRPCSLILLETI